VWLDEEAVYKREVDTRNELLACILDAAASIKLLKDENQAIFAHELQIELKWKGGFLEHLW
jgi:hypothetical protein